MVNEAQMVKLIEVNTNPWLELSSNHLARIIPAMIDNWIKIAVDPIFPAPDIKNNKKTQYPDYSENKFELIFNQLTDSKQINHIKQTEIIIEEDEDDDREESEEEAEPNNDEWELN